MTSLQAAKISQRLLSDPLFCGKCLAGKLINVMARQTITPDVQDLTKTAKCTGRRTSLLQALPTKCPSKTQRNKATCKYTSKATTSTLSIPRPRSGLALSEVKVQMEAREQKQ